MPHRQRAITSSKLAEQRAVALQTKTKSYTLVSSEEDEPEPVVAPRKKAKGKLLD